jgi:hypothetical protein
MTMPRRQAITPRQQALLLRSATLRSQLAAQGRLLQGPLALADRLRGGWRWLRAHPEVPVAAVVALAVLRPRRAWRWAQRAWWGWRVWQRLQRLQQLQRQQVQGRGEWPDHE